jgi:germination protein M
MKNIIILKKLFNKAMLTAVLCCLFLMFLTVFGCALLDSPDRQDPEETAEAEETTQAGEEASQEEDAESIEQDTEAGEEEAEEEQEEPEITEITINVYYSNDTAEYLVPESRIIDSENKYVDTLYELMKKPIDDSLVPLVPDTTRINAVEVVDGNAVVDLSQEFLDDRLVSDTVDNLLLYSIVNTLTQFPEVNSVELYIDGEKINILGQLDIKEPVFRRNDLIKDQ